MHVLVCVCVRTCVDQTDKAFHPTLTGLTSHNPRPSLTPKVVSPPCVFVHRWPRLLTDQRLFFVAKVREAATRTTMLR